MEVSDIVYLVNSGILIGVFTGAGACIISNVLFGFLIIFKHSVDNI